MNDADPLRTSDRSVVNPSSSPPVPNVSPSPSPSPSSPTSAPSSPSPSSLTITALVALAALIVVSLAFVPSWYATSLLTPVGTAPVTAGRAGLPQGLLLAIAKVGALAWLFARVRRLDVYTMQWSSMFILLFFAEGVVRATSDPSPTAAIGLGEALFAALYFAMVLAILRPLKRRARARQVPR